MLKLVLLVLLLGAVRCSFEPREEIGQESATPPVAPMAWISVDLEVAWKSWEKASFQQAQERNCPVLLYLAAPGCEGLFSRSGVLVRSLLEERFVAIRADPFRRPDIARRYAAGGWPALAILLPDGRAFTLAVDVPPENVELFLWRILSNFEKQRPVIERKLRQDEKQQLQAATFEVDVSAVYQEVSAAFDTLHGGFGRPFKFPEVGVLGFLLEYYAASRDEAAWRMVQRSLDALLESPLHDPKGGFSPIPTPRTGALRCGKKTPWTRQVSHWYY